MGAHPNDYEKSSHQIHEDSEADNAACCYESSTPVTTPRRNVFKIKITHSQKSSEAKGEQVTPSVKYDIQQVTPILNSVSDMDCDDDSTRVSDLSEESKLTEAQDDIYKETRAALNEFLPPEIKDVAADHEALSKVAEISEILKHVDEDLVQSKGDHVCKICGRTFRSVKSLHGHMRSHPNRKKGMNWLPEENVELELPGTVQSPGNCDGIQTLSDEHKKELRWETKSKRGKKGKTPLNLAFHENHPEYIAACILVNMQYNIGYGEPLDLTFPKEAELESKTKERKGLGSSSPTEKRVDSYATMLVQKSSESSDTSNYQLQKVSKKSLKRKRNADKEELINSPKAQEQRVYQCSTCKKCFPTHQALGGHRANHNKGKGNMPESTDHSLDQECGRNIMRPCAKTSTGEHKCKHCYKVFSSGQALGGHMRQHFVQSPVTPVEENVVAPVAESEETKGFLHGFDLNKLPLCEGEEGIC